MVAELSPIEQRYLKGWNEDFVPWPDEIIVDDSTAIMTRRAFERLPEYSTSLPTATYPGKRWKRNKGGDQWLMVEYVASDLPGQIGIKYRSIIFP